MKKPPLARAPEDTVYDDDVLLADAVLRTLHRNRDGHLAPHQRHKESVLGDHNVAILYLYLIEDDAYVLAEHYVYSPDSINYNQWCKIAVAEVAHIHKQAGNELHGVFGWITGKIQITPLRTGDLFIKINKDGASGVRLSFSARKAKQHARSKKTAKTRSPRRNRFR